MLLLQSQGVWKVVFHLKINYANLLGTGRYPVINATELDTTDLAAAAAWEVIQGFYDALPQLDANVASKTFNLGKIPTSLDLQDAVYCGGSIKSF